MEEPNVRISSGFDQANVSHEKEQIIVYFAFLNVCGIVYGVSRIRYSCLCASCKIHPLVKSYEYITGYPFDCSFKYEDYRERRQIACLGASDSVMRIPHTHITLKLRLDG